ncbi:MAG TPA: hypothetical protein VF310_11095 [Vicinamibacteria bacterium]
MALKRSPLVLILVLAATGAVAAVYLRRPPAQPNVETMPELPPPATEEPGPPPDYRPPQPAEVLEAVQRTLGEVVPPDAVRAHAAVVGDFNGDDSPDLVVPVRVLEEKLTAINDPDLANWLIQDPDIPPQKLETDRNPKRIVVEKGEAALAMIHGYRHQGWRSPDARQVILLKVDPGLIELAVRKRDDVKAKAVARKQPLPLLRGDLVTEAGRDRFLYWTGGRYIWHDPAAAKAAPAAAQKAKPAEKAKPASPPGSAKG